MRRKNLNALKRIQREKVRATGNNVGSVSTRRDFEELIVLCIPASLYFYIHVNPFTLTRQGREKASNIFLIHIAAEPLSA